MAEISIIIPCFNADKTIEELLQKIKFELKDLDYEIIAVNDSSQDGTLDKLKKIKNSFKNFKLIDTHKNYGQQKCLKFACSIASGNYILLIDDDLEDDPQDINKLYKKVVSGYDVVYCHSEKAGTLYNFLKKFFLFFLTFISGKNYKLVSNYMIFKNINSIKNIFNYPGSINSFLLTNLKKISYIKNNRKIVKTKTNYKFSEIVYISLIECILDTDAVKRIIYFFVIISFLMLVYLSYNVLTFIFFGVEVKGYTSLLSINVFFGLVLIAISLNILLLIAKIFINFYNLYNEFLYTEIN